MFDNEVGGILDGSNYSLNILTMLLLAPLEVHIILGNFQMSCLTRLAVT
jgi:hypothetical protein